MSCQECNYITGHDEFCTRGTADRLSDAERRLLARIEALEERVAELEQRDEQRAYAKAMEGA